MMRRLAAAAAALPIVLVGSMVSVASPSAEPLTAVEIATPDGWLHVTPEDVGARWVDGKLVANDRDVGRVLDSLSAGHRRAPVDGTYSIEAGEIVYRAGRSGAELDRAKARDVILRAFGGKRGLGLPVKKVEPRGLAVVAKLGEFKLHLYEGPQIKRTFPIGVGLLSYHSHTGEYRVKSKAVNPSWTNPGVGWARNMPRYVPPGPKNPLGSRALRLDRDLLAIHGTPQPWTVGTRASRGCMRMKKGDVEALFDMVPVGTPVFIFE